MIFRCIAIIIFIKLIFFSTLLAQKSDDSFRVLNIAKKYKNLWGERADALYLNNYIYSIGGLEELIRTWYRIPRDEKVIVAYGNNPNYGSVVARRFENLTQVMKDTYKEITTGSNDYQKGVEKDFVAASLNHGFVLTDKSFFLRLPNKSIGWASYTYINKYCTIYFNDNYVFVENKNKKKRWDVSTSGSQLTPFEIRTLIDDTVYSITQAKIEEQKEADKIRKKRVLAKQQKERGNLEIEIDKAISLFNSEEYKESFSILYKYKESPYFTPEAQMHLGIMYELSLGIIENYDKAISHYLEAATSGNILAQTRLSSLYFKGGNGTKKSNKAIKWLKAAAKQGDTDSQILLGAYHYGTYQSTYKRTKNNYQEGLKWFLKAAEQGDITAQSIVGAIYYNGNGVSKDFSKAAKWYLNPATQGDSLAQVVLGLIYYKGNGVDKNYKKALKWFLKAAKQGDASAQKCLGVMYHEGQGVNKDFQKALEWYKKSAKQGDITAQYNIGNIYYHGGYGVNKDYKEAFDWFLIAAEQGNSDAQSSIGVMYYNGNLVKQSYLEAKVWCTRAAEQNHKYAKEVLQLIKDKGY